MKLYSTCVRIACLIEDKGLERYMDSVHLLYANDKSEAFKKSLEIGYAHESKYLNNEHKNVRWAFKEIISLDSLANLPLDGLEVYSQPIEISGSVISAFDTPFYPDQSQPTESVFHEVE